MVLYKEAILVKFQQKKGRGTCNQRPHGKNTLRKIEQIQMENSNIFYIFIIIKALCPREGSLTD